MHAFRSLKKQFVELDSCKKGELVPVVLRGKSLVTVESYHQSYG